MRHGTGARALFGALLGLVVAGAGSLPAQQEPEGIARARLDYFYQLRSFPFAQLPPHLRRAEMNALRPNGAFLMGPNSSGPWVSLGPAPIGGARNDAGRVTALVTNPSDPATIYLGGAQGGLWKTTNTGASWSPLTDTQCSLAVGAVTLDPLNPNIVYVGTGEDNFSIDSYYGCGILKSSDGGTSWTTLGSSIFDTPSGGAYIGRVHIPAGQGGLASAVIYAATSFGLYKSTDAGASWTIVFGTSGATDVITDPTNGAVVYVAGTTPYPGGSHGIYKSTDGGATFSQLGGGLPTSNVGRIALAIIPSAPQTIFAAIHNSATGNLLGLFKSTNAGATWTQLAASSVNCSTQCWYAMVLAVDPANINTVYLGALSLYKSTDGGSTFSDAGGAIHVDHHAFAFDGTNSAIIYSGNDGGVYRSGDGGATWSSLNTNLSITQFYPGISVAPSGPNPILGGTQDNGTLQYSGSLMWTAAFGGDGGFTAINPLTPTQSFVETQWGYPSFSGPWRNNGAGYFQANTGINLNDPGLFIPPMVMDQQRPATLYFGTQRLYRTTNSGNLWTWLPALSATGSISTIGVSASDSNTQYVGTSQGELFVTSTGGASYALRTSGLATSAVTDIVVHRSIPTTAYVTLSGFGTGHVFKTINGGASWSNISGNLPNVPVNAIVMLPDGELDIGTDLGVYRSTDDGATWSIFVGGLPNVAVLDLLYHPGTSTLLAATHGRGMWSATVTVIAPPTLLAMNTQPGNGSSGTVLATQPVVGVRTAAGDPAAGATNVVTAALNVVSGSGTLSGTTAVAAVNGIATFTNLKVTGGGTFTITATSPGLTSVTSSQFIVSAAPTKLVITVQPSAAATNGVPFSSQPVIQIRDATDSLVRSATNPVTASLNVVSGSGTLGGAVTVAAVNGVATFTNLKITGTGTFTVTFAATGLMSATSGNVVVSVGAAKKLTITAQPAGAVNGVAFTTQPIVAIQDSLGATVPTATNQVTATLNVVTGSGTLGGTVAVNAVGGVATFTNLKITGTGTFTVTFAATGLTSATSGNVVVVVGAASTLALTTQPSGAVNGVAFTTQPVVAVQDAFGATVAAATNQVTASLNVVSGSGTLGGTVALNAVGGVATFTNLKITGTGTFTITFAATGLTSVTSGSVVVAVGPPSALALTTQPSGAVNGVAFSTQPVVVVQDAFGATVPTATNQLTASLNVVSGSGTLGGTVTVTAVNGVATFTNLTITGTGTFTITFAATGLTSATSGNVVVVAGVAAQLAITTQPAGVVTGVVFVTQPVVAVQDAFGATVAAATNQVTASLNTISGSGALGGTKSVTAVGGIATFTNLKITGAGTFSITFAATGLASVTSANLTVAVGAPTTLVLTTQPAGAINGVAFTTQPVVQLRDGTGALAGTATNPVTASLNVVSGSGTLGGTVTVAAVGGVATFTNLKISGTGTFTITFAATGLTSATSGSIVVVVGAAAALAITTQPGGAVNGVVFTAQPIVAIQDAFGATVPTATNQVTATLNTVSGSGVLSGTVTVTAVGGVATFTNLQITGAGTFTITFAAAGLTSATSGNLIVAAGAPTTLVLATPPAGAVSGVVFTTQPVVQVQDASGTLAGTASNPVTALLNTIAGAGTLDGTATVAAVNGVATFTNLQITGTGTFTLTFAAPGLTSVTSGNLIVAAGAPTSLALTTAPTGAVNGITFIVQPVIQVRDGTGSLVGTATNPVTASLNVLSGSGTLGGTTTVAAVNGIAAFTNLKITGTGTFTITFLASGLTSATSGNLIVSPGAATTLAMAVQPGGAVNGLVFGTQPVVGVKDAFGGTVPTAAPVTATLNIVSGSGTLGGTTTVAVSNGVATFTNLRISGTGTFTLTFAAAGLTSVTSANVVVVAGAPAKLALTTPPAAGAVSGVALTTQPVVAIQDALGATVPTAANQVTALLNVVSGTGTLGGTLTIAAVNGMASFTNLMITGSGTFTLTFGATGLVSAVSPAITVVPQFVLAVAGAGNGAGLVSGSGLSCTYAGGTMSGTCADTVVPGTPFNLAAAPSFGSVFIGWTAGGCTGTSTCQGTVAASTTVQATFSTATSLVANAVDELLGTPHLSADEKAYLDGQGNRNGQFDLGDLLAYLDRTNTSLAPGVLTRLLDRQRKDSTPLWRMTR